MLPSLAITRMPSSLESKVALSTAVECCSLTSVLFNAVTSFPMTRNSAVRPSASRTARTVQETHASLPSFRTGNV